MPKLMFRDDCGAECAAQLAGGQRGTADTLAAMQEFVADSVADPRMQTLAAGLAANVARGDRGGQLREVYAWLRSRLVFKADPFGVEHLIHPVRTLQEIVEAGRSAVDCDNVAMMGAALVALLGFEPVFIVTRRRPSAPWSHVFYGARVAGQVVPMDPQENTPFGQWPALVAEPWIVPALPPDFQG